MNCTDCLIPDDCKRIKRCFVNGRPLTVVSLPQVPFEHSWIHMGMHENYVSLCGVMQVWNRTEHVMSVPRWTERQEDVTCLLCLYLMPQLPIDAKPITAQFIRDAVADLRRDNVPKFTSLTSLYLPGYLTKDRDKVLALVWALPELAWVDQVVFTFANYDEAPHLRPKEDL